MATMFELFANEDTRRIFEALTNWKRADLRGLRESLSLPEEKASAALASLVSAGLVEQVNGPVPDFNTYFLSPKGLAASRQLGVGQRLSKAL